jgi:outer membrane biosynthesis protein TonB
MRHEAGIGRSRLQIACSQYAASHQAPAASTQYDVPPKFISGAAPSYPHTPLKLGAPGYAMISFTVDETGRTRDFRLWETNYMFFYTNAVAAIQK